MNQVNKLPKGLRAQIFATLELFLDLQHSIRSRFPDMDLESLLICCVANEAAMRRLLVGPHARPDLVDDPAPPDEARGSISRNLIAERTGLPRETVRRKVNQLIDAGILYEVAQGEVRPVPMLANPMFQTIAQECLAAVRRFDVRLRALGCDGVLDSARQSTRE
jgi:hypothetical protein